MLLSESCGNQKEVFNSVLNAENQTVHLNIELHTYYRRESTTYSCLYVA